MPLTANEIVAGCVAYLDGDALVADGNVQTPDAENVGVRPFLCFYAAGGTSKWVELTAQHRAWRLRLKPYKTGGTATWRKSESYVNDVSGVFEGPNISIIAASNSDYGGIHRPKINDDGVLLVASAVESCIQAAYEQYVAQQEAYYQQYVQPSYGGYMDVHANGLWFPPSNGNDGSGSLQ